MYVIQKKDVANILDEYDCEPDIVSIDMLSYYQQEDTICMVLKIRTSAHRYVIKLLCDQCVSLGLDESQSVYSEFLRTKGIPVPMKYMCSGRFCTLRRFSSQIFLVTVEDYFGEDVTFISPTSVARLGEIIGRVHSVSLAEQFHLPYGSTYRAITSGRAEILSNSSNAVLLCDVLKNEQYDQLICTHREKIRNAAEIWASLPVAAVHADLGLTNNFVRNPSGFGLIDFNLSGDEMLLGDFLITWYSSRYCFNYISSVSGDLHKALWEAYYNGYLRYRKFSPKEVDAFINLAKLMNGVFFGRFVIDMLNRGYVQFARKLAPSIIQHYNLLDTPLDLWSEVC